MRMYLACKSEHITKIIRKYTIALGRKSRGPSIEPLGTLHFVSQDSELSF